MRRAFLSCIYRVPSLAVSDISSREHVFTLKKLVDDGSFLINYFLQFKLRVKEKQNATHIFVVCTLYEIYWRPPHQTFEPRITALEAKRSHADDFRTAKRTDSAPICFVIFAELSRGRLIFLFRPRITY